MATDDVPIIDSNAALHDLCQKLNGAGAFAFDTEFIRDDTLFAQLCLVQVAYAKHVVLVDPLADIDLAPFWELVCDPKIVTIVHAGKEDFDICLTATGQAPRNVYDVQVAAGFCGHGYPLSLARLVDAVCNRKLSKGQTLTDWERRPLTDEQFSYAIEDVAHLVQVHQRLTRDIAERGRTAWADEEFAPFEDPHFYKPPVESRLFKLRGARKLSGRNLAVLSRLLEWREAWARERNRPIRALIRDDVLVEVAKRIPTKREQLEVLRGFPQSKNRRVIDDVLSLVGEAAKTPRAEWPKPAEIREETPMMKAVTDLLSALNRAHCHEFEVAHDLVGGTSRLRDLVDFALGRLDEPPQLLTGWRKQFIGDHLISVLDGRSEVHLLGWPQQPRLVLETHDDAR